MLRLLRLSANRVSASRMVRERRGSQTTGEAMKSLIKNAKRAKAQQCCEPAADQKVAQCCAKVSKTVAGCHD